MGHEFIGVIEAVGGDVETVKVGDQVIESKPAHLVPETARAR
jgi:D-arabinose 1-dehydrogenase-like Zn-dependent alcohol dehydrogenase